MSNKESVKEKLERLKREKEAAAKSGSGENTELVSQLTHESDGEPDYAEIAAKLKQRHEDIVSTSPEWVKFTIYLDRPVAEAFKALCVKHGDQRRYATEAFKDFVRKKTRELDIE